MKKLLLGVLCLTFIGLTTIGATDMDIEAVKVYGIKADPGGGGIGG